MTVVWSSLVHRRTQHYPPALYFPPPSNADQIRLNQGAIRSLLGPFTLGAGCRMGLYEWYAIPHLAADFWLADRFGMGLGAEASVWQSLNARRVQIPHSYGIRWRKPHQKLCLSYMASITRYPTLWECQDILQRPLNLGLIPFPKRSTYPYHMFYIRFQIADIARTLKAMYIVWGYMDPRRWVSNHFLAYRLAIGLVFCMGPIMQGV